MTTKRKAQKAAGDKPDPARQTVGDLLKTSGVPLHVQVWLNRYAGGDEHALEKYGSGDDPGINDAAFLVYDVLEAEHDGESVREATAEARDFVEEWLYTLSNYYGQYIWNNADSALAAFPYFFADGSPMKPEGDAAYVLLRTAVERLTTKPERRLFLRQDSEEEPRRDEETDRQAAFKLSRVLADPRTPAETRDEIERVLCEFANAAEVQLTHPALARRAFQLMCDARPKGKVRECRRLRGELLGLLDAAAEGEGGRR